MTWTVEALDAIVAGEIQDLPPDIRARLTRYSALIEDLGPASLPAKAFKHLEDDLWELRLQGRTGIGRAIYVVAFERRLVIVHAFVKKTQKTPLRSLKIARTRAKAIS